MKLQPKILAKGGRPEFVIFSYDEYQYIIEKLEDMEDIEAVKESILDDGECFPLDIVNKLADGENPIKVFREYRRLTQAGLAREVKITRQYIHQLEARQRQGSPELLKNIAKVLEVAVDDLI